jgi:hypothetical protein
MASVVRPVGYGDGNGYGDGYGDGYGNGYGNGYGTVRCTRPDRRRP